MSGYNRVLCLCLVRGLRTIRVCNSELKVGRRLDSRSCEQSRIHTFVFYIPPPELNNSRSFPKQVKFTCYLVKTEEGGKKKYVNA